MVEKQAKFLKTIAVFIQKATDMGYLFTSGEFWRPSITAQYYAKSGAGISRSLHTERLAADLNAFFGGKYLSGEEPGHIPHLEKLGKLWESLDDDCAWGGRFTKKDYNHYSFAHNGFR